MMIILLITDIVNHYMYPLVEELNKLEDTRAYFVETTPLSKELKKGGFSEYEDNSTIIRAWQGTNQKEKAMNLALTAEIMIANPVCTKEYERARLQKNLLTFEYSERPLKRGLLNVFSSANLRNQFYYHFVFKNKPLYMLCFSAFTALDEYRMHAFKGRCYKFGYLPRIENMDIDKVLKEKKDINKIRFIWCGRFINWKHPELPILLAEKLKKDGYDFEVNMIGSGVMFEKTKEMIVNKELQDNVHLLGNFPNAEVLKIMREHHIFLFTSDQREGWGVVLNEAMGQLCCPLASDMIGSSPYLLHHQENGLMFKSNDLNSLYVQAKHLLDNPDKIQYYAKNAYKTVRDEWNPVFIANRFRKLCESMLSGELSVYDSGPCSIDYPKL